MRLFSLGFFPLSGRLPRWSKACALITVAGYCGTACKSDSTPALRAAVAGKGGQGGAAGHGGRPATAGGGNAGGGRAGGSAGTGGHAGSKPDGSGGSGGTIEPELGGEGGFSQAGAGDAGEENGGSPGAGGSPGSGGVANGAGGSAGGLASGGVGGTGGHAGNNCTDNAPEVLVTAPDAWAVAVDGDYVYFTTHRTDGEVSRVPVGGGPVEQISQGEIYPYDIAVSTGLVFWSSLESPFASVIRATTSGTDRRSIAQGDDDLSGIFSLSADADYAYYVTDMNVVRRVPTAGGATPVQIGDGAYNSTIVDMVLFNHNLYWTDDGVGTFQTTEAGSAVVASADTAGTSVSKLVTLLDFPQYEIAVNGAGLFWSDGTAIHRTALEGGTYTTVATLPAVQGYDSPIVDMLVDDTNLFYADRHTLYRVSIDGGEPEIMATGYQEIVRLAQDAGNLYFSDALSSEVVRLAKCASAAVRDTGAGGASGSSGAGGAPGSSGAGGASQTGGVGGIGNATGGVGGIGGATGGVAGAAGSPSTATPLLSVPHLYGLELNEGYLYFSTLDPNGEIARVPLAGGDAEPLAPTEDMPHDIAVDANNVYFCLADTNAGHLAYVPKAGGARVALADGIVNALGRVYSDGKYAYYTTAYNSVYRVPVTGGDSALVAAGPYHSGVQDMVVDRGTVFLANLGVFNSDNSLKLNTGYAAETPVTGQEDLGHHTLQAGLTFVQRITTDQTAVYFVDGTTLWRANRAGGAAVQLGPVPAAANGIRDMLSDGTNVYIAADAGIYRMSVNGGELQTVTSGWTAIRSLADDGANIYFTEYSAGVLMKQPK
jgi:hypothetical protein